jgi:hypothetical protein
VPGTTSNYPDNSIPDEHSKWVLVLRRLFGYENYLRKTKFDVKSLLIKDAIQEACPPERAATEGEKPVNLRPNDELFRHVSARRPSYRIPAFPTTRQRLTQRRGSTSAPWPRSRVSSRSSTS